MVRPQVFSLAIEFTPTTRDNRHAGMTKKQRKLTRARHIIELLRKIYGYSNVPRGPGSVHEGDELDDAELILHELAHQTLMPPDYVFTPGGMEQASDIVDSYLKARPDWLSDVHELYSVAIELLVGRHYKLGLNEYGIIEESYLNTNYYLSVVTLRKESWGVLVRRAMKTNKAITRAETIVAFVDHVDKEGI